MTYHTDNRFSVIPTKDVEVSTTASKLANIVSAKLDPKALIEEVLGESKLQNALDTLSRNGDVSTDLGVYKSLKYDLSNHIQDIKVSADVYVCIQNKLKLIVDRTYLYAHTGLFIEPIDDEKSVVRISFKKCYEMFDKLMLALKHKKGEAFVPTSREEHLHKCIVKYIESMQRQLTTAN